MGLEYRCYMTQAGYALQAKLFAEGGDMIITRVMVGGGVRAEDAEPSLLTDLVQPMAQATSTKPVRICRTLFLDMSRVPRYDELVIDCLCVLR